MDQSDVEKALDEQPSSYGQYNSYVRDARFSKVGVDTLYDAETGRLKAVAVDALIGPRVRFLDEVELIGRPPSEVAGWFLDNHQGLGVDLRINQCGDPAFDELGLVLSTQRAGDHLLSRAIFVARDWAERCGDTSESPLSGLNIL
ncbi:hypothetical protein ABZS29_34075 [Kribbella sp. NPDC005582]|uniref:hypothetical protein n=1 Tax=Kribbella sp. NPDC005582 TaxID=3156893 RepID=UPI0033A1229B